MFPFPKASNLETGIKLKFYICTVKLGYNDHGYNEITAITNKFEPTVLVPNGRFTT